MTRLNAMRDLLERPDEDNHRRASRVIYGTADPSKVTIVKPKRRGRKKPESTRIAWLRGVIESRRGA